MSVEEIDLECYGGIGRCVVVKKLHWLDERIYHNGDLVKRFIINVEIVIRKELFFAGLHELQTPPVPFRLLRVQDGSIGVLSKRIVHQ